MSQSKKAKTEPLTEEQIAEKHKAIEDVKTEIEKLYAAADEEVLKIEQKYSLLRKPVLKKRNEIASSIPDYWLSEFLNHPRAAYYITEEDHQILKHLAEVWVEEAEDIKQGYKIIFKFSSNKWFNNAELIKDIKITEEGTKVTSTKINWKEGMNPNKSSEAGEGNKRSFDDVVAESFLTSFFNDEDHEIDLTIKEEIFGFRPPDFEDEEAEEEEGEGEGGDGEGGEGGEGEGEPEEAE